MGRLAEMVAGEGAVATLRLLAVLAHPDDESLGIGGALARYAAEGVETSLVTATRGERGWPGDPQCYPGPAALGRIREAELLAAARALGLREVAFLDYLDGELDRADPAEASARIAGHLRRVRPQVVVSFGPDGAYGHPDHIAIAQFTAAAIVRAADANHVDPAGQPPHTVAKLYYQVVTAPEAAAYQALFGELVMRVDGAERRAAIWPEWAVTTRVDATAHWRAVRAAVACHRSQVPNHGVLARLPAAAHRRLWGEHQTYYRAFSLVNSGAREDDLFAGLRGA